MRTIYLSSCEAKYNVAKEETKKAIWIWHVLIDLGLVQKSPTYLRCDNQNAIHLAYNSMYHPKDKNNELSTH